MQTVAPNYVKKKKSASHREWFSYVNRGLYVCRKKEKKLPGSRQTWKYDECFALWTCDTFNELLWHRSLGSWRVVGFTCLPTSLRFSRGLFCFFFRATQPPTPQLRALSLTHAGGEEGESRLLLRHLGRRYTQVHLDTSLNKGGGGFLNVW